LDKILLIYNTDLSPLFLNKSFDESKRYYVYAHCNSDNKINPRKSGKLNF